MKKFQFRLAGLLRVRRIEEEKKLLQKERRRMELAALESELNQISSEREKCIEDLIRLNQGVLDTIKVLALRRYINVLNRQFSEKSQRRPILEEAFLLGQNELRAAVRAREAVERLREKKYQIHLKEAAREESLELDELSRNRRSELSGVESGS